MKSQNTGCWVCGQKLGKFRKAAFESKGRATVGALITNSTVIYLTVCSIENTIMCTATENMVNQVMNAKINSLKHSNISTVHTRTTSSFP